MRLPGSFLLRLHTRTFLAELFQEPPRFTRLEPLAPFAVILITWRQLRRQCEPTG